MRAQRADDQDGVDVRVLIIDDASPDDSAQAALQLAAGTRASRFASTRSTRATSRPTTRGCWSGRTVTTRVLLSADDLLTPGALRRARRRHGRRPERRFRLRARRWWRGRPAAAHAADSRARASRSGRARVAGARVPARRTTSSPRPRSSSARRVQQRVGGYDPELPHTGDIRDVDALRAARRRRLTSRGRPGLLPHPRAEHAEHVQRIDGPPQKRLAFEVTLERYGDRLSDPRRLRNGINRRLSHEALAIATRSVDLGTADRDVVGQLVDFAMECWPKADRFPIYHTLRARRHVDPRILMTLQPSRPAELGDGPAAGSSDARGSTAATEPSRPGCSARRGRP